MSLRVSHPQPSAALEEQIRALLDTCRRATTRPSMSIEEMAVAIITIDPDVSLLEVQRHILKAFKYYNNAAVECSMTRGYQSSLTINHFNATFDKLLHRFEIPIEVSPADPDDPEDDDELYVEPSAAKMFLHKHLTSSEENAQKDKRPFPFLKLPAELRLQIYGHCIGLPKHGVAIRQASRHAKKKEVVVRTKDFDAELQLSEWEDRDIAYSRRNYGWSDRNDGTFICTSLRTHLALLSVNKEIFNEAMPVFYSINSFVCSDLLHLEDFLATLAPERRQQLKHISFFYTKQTHSKAAKAFKMLGEIEKLKRLDIMIDEEEFIGLKKLNGSRMFPDMLKLPGFHTLRSMRAVKTVQFHGKCDTIRNALQSWVVDNEVKAAKPKPKTKPKPKKETVRKVVTRTTHVAEEDWSSSSSSESDSEDEQAEKSLFKTAPVPSEAKIKEEVLSDDDEPGVALFQRMARSSPFDHPSTPSVRAPKTSPFKFNPTNLGSHLASRFHTQGPSATRGQIITPTAERHSLFSGMSNTTPYLHGKDPMISGASTPSYYEDEYDEYGDDEEDEQEAHQATTSSNKPKTKTFFTSTDQLSKTNNSSLNYFPLPNIAERVRMYGPGIMGDWRTPPGMGLQTQATPAPSPTFMQKTFMDQAAAASNSASRLDDPFVEGDGTIKMEDLLNDHEEYELMQ